MPTASFFPHRLGLWLKPHTNWDRDSSGSGTCLRPTASMGSSSSLMSCWMPGPMARASMLMQVNTVASTCTFCLLQKNPSVTSLDIMAFCDVLPQITSGAGRQVAQTGPPHVGVQVTWGPITLPSLRTCRFTTNVQQMAVKSPDKGPHFRIHTKAPRGLVRCWPRYPDLGSKLSNMQVRDQEWRAQPSYGKKFFSLWGECWAWEWARLSNSLAQSATNTGNYEDTILMNSDPLRLREDTPASPLCGGAEGLSHILFIGRFREEE